MKLRNSSILRMLFTVCISIGLAFGFINPTEVEANEPDAVPSTTAGWVFEGEETQAYFGYYWRSAGDVNGDGYDDLIANSYMRDTGNGENSGQAMLFLGSETGFDPDFPDWIKDGENAEDRFGFHADGIGDINGDGYDDVLIGAHNYDLTDPLVENVGKIYLFLGSPTGLSPDANWTMTGTQNNQLLGYNVAGAGDVNGDGLNDIAAVSFYYSNPETHEGLVSVIYGSRTGLGTEADWTAESNQENANFGVGLNTLGDVNGDGYDDLIVGADMYDNGQDDEGAAFVWYGSASGLNEGVSGTPANADWMAESNVAGGSSSRYFAYFVGTPGDVNGDGFDEVILSHWEYTNPSTAEGGAFVWFGSENGPNNGVNGTPGNSNWHGESNTTGFAYGTVTGKPNDINGDGYSDVVLGCQYYNYGYGAVLSYFGSETGLGANGDLYNSDWIVAGSTASEYYNSTYSWQAGSVGDANGDGIDDVVSVARLWQNHVTEPDYQHYGKLFAYYSTNTYSVIKGRVNWCGEVCLGHQVYVTAHDAIGNPVLSHHMIDAGDKYRLNDLEPGTYYVRAFVDLNDSGGDEPDGDDVMAWYDMDKDGTPDPIEVTANDLVINIDITLRPYDLYLPAILK